MSSITTTVTTELLAQATDEEKAELAKLLPLAAALDNPLDFAAYVSPETEHYRHVVLIAEYLKALHEYRLYRSGPGPAPIWHYLDRKTRKWRKTKSRKQVPKTAVDIIGVHPDNEDDTIVLRLGIVMPPRHGKSWITTQHFPIWLAALNPRIKLCVYTYSDDMGHEWGADLKNRIIDNEAKLGFTVKGGAKAKQSFFELTNGSSIRTGGVGGMLVGKGWDFGIIDDPFKGEEAYSKAERDRKARWYGGTWSNRRENIWAREIMMFTRWHEDDLSGRYMFDDLGSLLPEWCLLHLEALCEDPDADPLGRAEGEALCPERFNEAFLEAQKSEHPQQFEALYQGDPTVEEGGVLPKPYPKFTHVKDRHNDHLLLFKRGGIREAVPYRELRFFGVADIAATTKARSDWTVFTYWGMDPQRRIFLLDLLRFRMELPDVSHQLLDWYLRKKPAPMIVGVEQTGAGLPIIQGLQRQTRLAIKPLEPKNYGGDKHARAIPAGQALQHEEIFISRESEHLVKLEIEMKTFPHGTYDDQVDCVGYANQLRFELPVWTLQTATDLTPMEEIDRAVDEAARQRQYSEARSVESLLSSQRPV